MQQPRGRTTLTMYQRPGCSAFAGQIIEDVDDEVQRLLMLDDAAEVVRHSACCRALL